MSAITVPDLVVFNVGGREFAYDRSSVVSSGENLLSLAISGVWKEQKSCFINANLEVFGKWIDPFIRYSILPDISALKDTQEANTLYATVDYLGMQVLMDHLNPPKIPIPECAFGKEKWEKYFGDVGEEPPLPADIEEILKADCPFFPGKKVEETHVLTLIPATVNGMRYNLNRLSTLILCPKKDGHEASCRYDNAKDEHGQISSPMSYWVLMSKHVINRYRYQTWSQQLEIAKMMAGYEAPRLLEAATVVLMHLVDSGERVLHGWTCCQELVMGGGGFVGMNSMSIFLVINYVKLDATYDCFGVAPLRKFL